MKKLIAPLAALLFFSFGITGEKLTDEERAMAVAKLTETHEKMMKTLDGLSEAQLNYKADPESWSIAECVEHLTISENGFGEMLKGAMSTTPDENMSAAATMTDDEIYAMMISREKKVKTSEPMEPSGKFGNYEETLANLITKRTEHIEYLKTTDDDFRSHYQEMSFGTVDAYQMVLMMAGHTERHTSQIEEIMADEGFPTE